MTGCPGAVVILRVPPLVILALPWDGLLAVVALGLGGDTP